MALDLGSSGQLDDMHVSGAAVLKVNEVLYRMWYSGHDGSVGYRIFYATSEDEINWVRQGLALDQGGPGDKDDDGAAYPCVIKDDNGFHKIYYGGVVGGLDMSILWATSPSTPENCNLTSVKISLPSGQTWGSLRINKTEPGEDNYINISILDGETNETILGFENLAGTDIDLSSIDYIAHPTLRLFANFDVNESEMPLLHDWEVTWEDTIAPATPSGFAVNNPFTGFSLIISWDPNFEEDLTTYVLYYSTDNSTFYRLTNLSSDTVYYIHYGRILNQTYYYKVSAADEVPNESPSTVVLEGTPDLDFDGDGIGNNLDTDDDNDGIPDLSDSYPLNPLNDIETRIDHLNETINDIQNRVIDIRFELDNMNLNDSALRIWLDAVLFSIDINLTQTNETLHNQLKDLDILITSFYNTLRTDIGGILSALQLHDNTTGENHSDIIDILSDLLNGQIEEEKIDDLRTKLINLAQNLSSHNQSIANNILDVVNDIDTYKTETQQKLNAINTTLVNLVKLDAIIDDLISLNQLFQTMEEDMQESKSKEEEIDDKIIIIELLMIIVLVLLFINLILTLYGNRLKGSDRNLKMKKRIEKKEDQDLPPPPPLE
jgi:hypothetical protein